MRSALCSSVRGMRPLATPGTSACTRPGRASVPRNRPTGARLVVTLPWAPLTQLQQHSCCAYRRATEPPQSEASTLARTLTNEIKQCDSLIELSDIVDEWGSSFDHIHTSAAFAKAAKLGGNRQAAGSQQKLLVPLLTKLSSVWASVQPDAQAWGLANVLWASSKLRFHDGDLWSSTMTAFLCKARTATCQELCNAAYAMAVAAGANRGSVPGLTREEVQQAMRVIADSVYVMVTNPQLEGVVPQDLSNFLWALGKLQCNPGQAELAAIVRAVVKPQMLDQSNPQPLVMVLYALSELRECCDLPGAIAQRHWQQLLGGRRLAQIARSRVPQHPANTLLALARLSSSNVISDDFGQNCAAEILQHAPSWDLNKWTAQGISNSLWACGKLHLVDEGFLRRVAAAAVRWVPQSATIDIMQAATGLGDLQYRDQTLVTALAKHSKQILQHAPSNSSIQAATVVALITAQLDMQPLALQAVELLQCIAVQRRERLHPADASRLYRLHEWLVDNQLLDGRGLDKLLSNEQLAQGKESEEQYHQRRFTQK